MKYISFFLVLGFFFSNALARCNEQLETYLKTHIAWCNTKGKAADRESCIQEGQKYVHERRSSSDDYLMQLHAGTVIRSDAIRNLRLKLDAAKNQLPSRQENVSKATDPAYKTNYIWIVAATEKDICEISYLLGLLEAGSRSSASVAGGSERSNQSISKDANSSRNRPNDDPLSAKSTGDVARAAETQAKADAQARRAGRRTHDPAAEASECIEPNFAPLYGGMKNKCAFKVHYTYCGSKPEEKSWLKGIMECERQKFGAGAVSPGREDATHTRHVERLYWIACKDPAWPVDTEFVPGQGIRGRCRNVGGN